MPKKTKLITTPRQFINKWCPEASITPNLRLKLDTAIWADFMKVLESYTKITNTIIEAARIKAAWGCSAYCNSRGEDCSCGSRNHNHSPNQPCNCGTEPLRAALEELDD